MKMLIIEMGQQRITSQLHTFVNAAPQGAGVRARCGHSYGVYGAVSVLGNSVTLLPVTQTIHFDFVGCCSNAGLTIFHSFDKM